MRILIVLLALSGFLSVAAGAFGAHAIPDVQARGWIETGAHWQSVHALAGLVALALFKEGGRAAAWVFIIGALLFPGALYALAFGAPRWFGAIAPLGGAAFLIGWVLLAVRALFPAGARA